MIRPLSPLLQYILASAILLTWAGCANKDGSPVAPTEPVVAWQSRLPNLVFDSQTFFAVQAIVSGVSAELVDSVRAAILPTDSVFRLYDDGNAFTLTDHLTFADSHSGDNVPLDGKFSRRINSLFTDQQGTFIIRVTAWVGNNVVSTDDDTLIVLDDHPPQLSNLVMPASLPSGFPPQQASLQAIDPDSASGDQATVHLRLYSSSGNPYDPLYTLQRTTGNTFVLPLTAAFAAGRPTGDYTFRFYAIDTYNLQSNTIDQVVNMENLGPHLSDPTVPETIQRPAPDDTTHFTATVRCWDDQSITDLSEVKLRTYYVPGQSWGTEFHILFDDGQLAVSGDSIAGDGIYSRSLSIWPSNQLGLYQFHFYGADHAGNQSTIIDSLSVV